MTSRADRVRNRALACITPFLLIVVLLVAAAPRAASGEAAAADASTASLSSIDAFVEQAMKDWKVPGVGLAIVHDGEVLVARGYGVREIGKPAAVDGDTVFAIGSSSKAFTAACIGLLVDQKKVEWDDPVTKHLAGFELHDSYATRDLTIRDLLTHRSGLARADQLWYASGYDRAEILDRVGKVEPSWGFRSRFGYQNIMFLAAGELYAAVAGESWDDCVTKRIFAPLRMARSTTSVDPLPGMENVASPHEDVAGTVTAVPWRDLDNVAPAGSINSSAREMAAWVLMQLAEGRAPGGGAAGSGAGAQVIAESTVREMHTPQMVVRKEGSWANYFPASTLITYGLGWFAVDYRGEIVIEHGGSIDGMRALVSMIPAKNLGVVVLTNRGGQNLPEALRYRVYDTLLGLPPKDWNAELLALNRKARDEERGAREARAAARVSGTKPSLGLAAYAGVYEHPAYGEVKVTLEKGALVLTRGEIVSDLAHWHYDTFEATYRGAIPNKLPITFQLDAEGKPAELVMGDLGVFSARAQSADRE